MINHIYDDGSHDTKLHENEQRSIYESMMNSQNEYFKRTLSELIQSHISNRISLGKQFSIKNDRKSFNDLFSELFKLVIKTLSDYFGIRRVS